jgi:hypothetical protein
VRHATIGSCLILFLTHAVGCEDVGGEPRRIVVTPSLADASEDSGDASAGADVSVDVSSLSDVVPQEITEAGLALAAPLSVHSPQCFECARASCGQYINGCALVPGVADAGDASGEAKSKLCVETVGCVISTGCAASSPGDCYCGSAGAHCVDFFTSIDGPCKSVLEESLESTERTAVLASFGDLTKGGGWAMRLVQCLADANCTSCLGSPIQEAGPEAADAPDDVEDALDEGDVPIEAEAGLPVNEACAACERQHCAGDAAMLTPACDPFKDREHSLCERTLECVRSWNCAVDGLLSCYCGTSPESSCLDSAPPITNGPCAGILSESTFQYGRELKNHLTDVKRPGGAAMALIQCDIDFCPNECFPYVAGGGRRIDAGTGPDSSGE